MVKFALLVHLEAQPGKEEELADLLGTAAVVARGERTTLHWFAFRLSASTFCIFDTFRNEEDRQFHLNGPIATGLLSAVPELLAIPPIIKQVDLVAVK